MQEVFSVAELLSGAQPGDERSMAALLPLVYEELKLLAGRQLNGERQHGKAHTLQPTALVHEAFLKMVGNDKGWAGRDHFMAVAATAMRRVLVDHSRRKTADKRGGGRQRDPVSIEGLPAEESGPDTRELRVVELDHLLKELAASGGGARVARVAEMRLFGGMDMDQIARVTGVSRMTIHRDWQVARAWLAAKMQDSRHE